MKKTAAMKEFTRNLRTYKELLAALREYEETVLDIYDRGDTEIVRMAAMGLLRLKVAARQMRKELQDTAYHQPVSTLSQRVWLNNN
jgi:peptide subunit release factor RF-3